MMNIVKHVLTVATHLDWNNLYASTAKDFSAILVLDLVNYIQSSSSSKYMSSCIIDCLIHID